VAELGSYQQAAPVAVENMFHNRKPQARSPARPAFLHADPVEAFRQAWDMFFRDPAPLVDDGQGNKTGLASAFPLCKNLIITIRFVVIKV